MTFLLLLFEQAVEHGCLFCSLMLSFRCLLAAAELGWELDLGQMIFIPISSKKSIINTKGEKIILKYLIITRRNRELVRCLHFKVNLCWFGAVKYFYKYDSISTQVAFNQLIFYQFILLFSLFLLLFMTLLHFLILFIGYIVLFQLTSIFIYNTFNKKI